MGNDDDRPGLLDDLAGRILAASPYRFDLAVNAEDRSTAYRIRAVASSAAGWARPGDFPDGMERDDFDDVAVHVLGRDGADPVCTGRLVFPPSPLPTEVACGLVVEPRGRVVDVGRMSVSTSAAARESNPRSSRVAPSLIWSAGTSQILLIESRNATDTSISLYRPNRIRGVDVADPPADDLGQSMDPTTSGAHEADAMRCAQLLLPADEDSGGNG